MATERASAFDAGVFTEVSLWKRRIRCFPFTSRWRNLKILYLRFRKTRSGKSRDYRDVIVLIKTQFQNVYRPHKNKKPVVSSFSGFKSVFEKPFLMDGAYLDYFVWIEKYLT